MTGIDQKLPSAGLRRGLIVGAAAAAVVALAVVALYGPVVPLALTGDSYQWIQHAHAAAHRPALLVADLDTFLRPSTTWTLVIDRFVWGGFDARGYRTTSLVLHGLAALALVAAGRRLGLGPVVAALVALIWVTSPFTDESAFVVAYRFQPLLLLAWLVLVSAWPRAGASWTSARLVVVAAAIVGAAAAKETWVVTPALVLALEIDRRRSLREAVPAVLLAGAAAAVYVTVYFVAFPTSKSYYSLGPHVAAKIPQQLAAFLFLQESRPFSLSPSLAGLLALAAVGAVAAACLRWRVAGTWVALALLVLPTVPTLLVPYQPQRYLAIPYAGFLLLAALWIGALAARLTRWRSAIGGLALVVAILLMVAGCAMVRADLADYRAMAAAHSELLVEAGQAVDSIDRSGPTVIVRDEVDQPLATILRDPRGLPKLPYTRHQDPYGLIDAAALFEWVLSDEGTRVERIDDWATACVGVGGSVIIHRQGGFVDLGATPDVAAEAARWLARHRELRVVRVVPLD